MIKTGMLKEKIDSDRIRLESRRILFSNIVTVGFMKT